MALLNSLLIQNTLACCIREAAAYVGELSGIDQQSHKRSLETLHFQCRTLIAEYPSCADLQGCWPVNCKMRFSHILMSPLSLFAKLVPSGSVMYWGSPVSVSRHTVALSPETGRIWSPNPCAEISIERPFQNRKGSQSPCMTGNLQPQHTPCQRAWNVAPQMPQCGVWRELT